MSWAPTWCQLSGLILCLQFRLQADKASTTLIRPMKFGDDKSKAPASFLFLAGAWLNLEPFRLDSTSAVSESHTFSRNRRRYGQDDDYRVYRYDVFQITLRHLFVIVMSMSSPQTETSTPDSDQL